ncbi:protein arginine methyltransferase NDUFAF7, mitochondrial isoform 2-T2 [Spinachia spinachia]
MRLCFGVKTQQLIRRVFSHPGRWPAAESRLSCSSTSGDEKPRPSMLRHLTSRIKATGPITVAEYMREALTNPVTGYYVRNNMLGPDGDFITSPEISQIFGEVFSQLQSVVGGASVSLHLVEVSPVLSRLQAQQLTGSHSREADAEDEPVYRHGETAAGLPVSWYRRLEDVPTGFSIFLAHEFFDALPIHKFQRTQRGWREVMVDVDPEKTEQLRFVVAPSPTLASSTLVQADERRPHVEVCAEGGVLVQQLARRIEADGGAALIADYGHDGTKTDTFRGFKGHRLHDVLSFPGSADLTADVDFSFLRRVAGEGVACLGPITQRTFLKNMGIDSRMQVLLRSCSDESTRQQLIDSYDVLTNAAKMGERFLFFGLLHHGRLAPPPQPQGPKLEIRKRKPAPPPVAGFTELSFS